ncbi:variable surface protein [Plasmodium gonderi]|uniref:Variable surface protein n=1 Tax=Plasmodium gonderi TaxID=77519 RepID=A0A1Y1JTA2_PLAGO|nr:variable surface protein [Plasmodium gonderi]GAW84668.1 variable surface protein [Plasmodium gonderi]
MDDIFNPLDILFSKYKNIMDEENEAINIYNGECQRANKDVVGIETTIFENNICPKTIKYLFTIHGSINNLYKDGLKYLYYWLYMDQLNAEESSDNVKKIYEKLLSIYNKSDVGTMRPNALQDNIDGDEWEKIKDLCDFFSIINDIRGSTFKRCSEQDKCRCAQISFDKYMRHHIKCKDNSSLLFCNVYENIESVFNELMLTNSCSKIRNQMLAPLSFQNKPVSTPRTNSARTIIISTLVTILIPSLLFSLYEVNYDVIIHIYFTPYNSFFRRVIMKIINKLNSINKKEWNILQYSDTPNSFSWDRGYNMLYNST